MEAGVRIYRQQNRWRAADGVELGARAPVGWNARSRFLRRVLGKTEQFKNPRAHEEKNRNEDRFQDAA